MMANPHVAGRGRDHRVATRSARTTPSSTCAARSLHVDPPAARRRRRGLRRRLPRHRHPRHRLRPRDRRARRRRRLHLRRGDGAARLARGLPRPAAAAPAVPGRRRASTPARPSSTTSSRSPACRASSSAAPTWFAGMGTEKSQGLHALHAVRPRARPGQYEAPLGITLRELLDMAGGIREGHELKFWTPGGSSTPLLHRRAPRRPARLRGASPPPARCSAPRRCMVLRRDRPASCAACCAGPSSTRTSRCGKCTPCREGTYWMVQILERLEARARHARTTSTRCSTPATTSSAARSAPSATARPARSSARHAATSATSYVALLPPEQQARLGRSLRLEPVGAAADHDDHAAAAPSPATAPAGRARPTTPTEPSLHHRRLRGRACPRAR